MLAKLKWTVLISLAIANACYAGPPFLSDDPNPTPFQHWELYFFEQSDINSTQYQVSIPAFEADYGIAENLEVDVIAPMVIVHEYDEKHTPYGIGDISLSVKWRFLTETKTRPEIAFVPVYSIPSGSVGTGLGNGRGWGQLPIWLQKTFEGWGQVYGGGGWAFNSQAEKLNYFYGGLTVTRELNDWMLGGEIFAQGATQTDLEGTVLLNLGGAYSFTKNISLIFSLGHSVAGARHFISYVGVYAFL